MKIQDIFCTKLIIYLIYSVSLLIGTYSTEDVSSDDSLTQLLRDREARIKQFHILSEKTGKMGISIESALLLLGTVPSDKFRGELPLTYSLVGVVHDIFVNKSWGYRREAYQLIRDLDTEVLPVLYDQLPCIQDEYSDNSNLTGEIHSLLAIVYRLGNCLNLTYVDTNGNKVNQTETELIFHFDIFVSPETFGGKFIDSTTSTPPKIQRIRRILNAITTLSVNADKDKEFIGGKTEWYGGGSEHGHKLWKELANYVFTVRKVEPFSISETDDSEKASLLEERQQRLATFKEDEIDNNFNEYLSQVDEVLDSLSKGVNPTAINTTFPQLVLTPELSKELRIEMYALVKDLLIEWGKVVHEDSPLYSEDFLGVPYVHTPFSPDSVLDTRDIKFNSTVFSELKYIAKLYNLTYVDYNGNLLTSAHYGVRGKYIDSPNSTESSTSRRLRHIINGFERLYFDILKEEGTEVRTSIMTDIEGAVNCTYRPITDFFDIGFSEDEILQHILVAHYMLLESNAVPPDFRNISDTIEAGRINETEHIFEQSDKWPLFKQAYKCFAKESLQFRTDIYKYIGEYYIQEQATDAVPWACPQTSWHNHDMLLHTSDTDTCVHNFLRLVQQKGRQYDLIYVDDKGEQVSVESYPSGKFVFILSLIFPEERTNPCAIAMKYLLEKLIELIDRTNS